VTRTSPRSKRRAAVLLLAVAALIALTVWLGVRNSSDAGEPPPSEQTSARPQHAGAEEVAPSAGDIPAAGVVLPEGAEQHNGHPIQFPYTDLGAVAVQAAVVRSMIGFDYDQAIQIATLYAAPEDRAVFQERARAGVADLRNRAGIPVDGPVSAPATFASTPIAYTVEKLDVDYYAVNILSYHTLTDVDGENGSYVQAATQLVRWIDGDWKLARGDAATIQRLVDDGQPRSVAPGTPEFERQGWIAISGEPQ
jgi:hypothetical protein